MTSLPEVATTVTAGALGNPQLAIGNLMGGVALQVVVIAVADVIESRHQLTFQVSQPAVLVQHVALLLLLALVVAAIAVGEPASILGIGLWPVFIAGVYGATLVATKGADRDGGWNVAGDGPRLGPVSGTFVGAVLVALTTSLPELSTVVGALRRGSYDMAVSNIMGTNGLEVALLLVADVAYREGAVLDHATSSDLFLAALASVLTCLYLGGLLLRRERTVLRVGHDSAAVLVAYAGGIVVLALMG